MVGDTGARPASRVPAPPPAGRTRSPVSQAPVSMRFHPIAPGLALGLTLASAAWAAPAWAAPQDPASQPAERPDEDLEARFAALSAGYDAAMEAFYEAYAALPADAGPEDLPPYPGEAFFDRFDALAEAGSVDAMFWCLDNGMGRGTEALVADLYRVFVAAPGDERMGDLFAWLHWSVPGPDEALLEALDAYLNVAPTDELSYAAMAAKGMVLTLDETDADATAEGLALLEGLLELEVEFPGRDGLAGQVYKLKHLGLGMVAPDWSAADVDGEPIALSDYRGKVTVLEFWGFW